MRVLILSVADKRHMPMAVAYDNYLENKNISYDIIRTNRYISRDKDIIESHKSGNIYEMNMVFPPATKKYIKFFYFIRFRRKVIRIIKERKYSFIIVWNENTAAIFSGFLSNKYKGRYCVNVRDVYDKHKIMKKYVDRAIKDSAFVTVPTPELKLPHNEKVLCVYNRDLSLLKLMKPKKTLKNNGEPIVITHLGFYYKVKNGAQEIVDVLGNDDRFKLIFAGQGFDTEFKQYIDSKGYKNVDLHGAFNYEDTAKYLEESDIVNSYYNHFTHPSLKVSFGIKHSYTPMLYIPGLADEDTFWGRLVKEYGIVYLVNDMNRESLADDLYKWYTTLDYDSFKENCDRFNQMIGASIDNLYKKLDELI